MSPDPAAASDVAALAAPLGERATLVQFSTAFCRPCAAARHVLARAAARHPGVRHVEVDAESHLGAVRALGITRTPTVLLLDPAGREVRRLAGAPRLADVDALLAALGAPGGQPR